MADREWLEKMRSIGVVSRRSGDQVREGRDEQGHRFKAVTDELGNTVTQRHDTKIREDVQDVQIRAPLVRASLQQREERQV